MGHLLGHTHRNDLAAGVAAIRDCGGACDPRDGRDGPGAIPEPSADGHTDPYFLAKVARIVLFGSMLKSEIDRLSDVYRQHTSHE